MVLAVFLCLIIIANHSVQISLWASIFKKKKKNSSSSSKKKKKKNIQLFTNVDNVG